MPLAISSNCECRPIADRHCELVIRCCRTTALRGPTNFLQKEVAMKRSTITSIALLAALVGSSAASAASYDYTPHYSYVGKPALPDARLDAQLQAATVTCDDAVGVQRAKP
jgi:cytochrome c-type biogenesis protein CcmH/NrfG